MSRLLIVPDVHGRVFWKYAKQHKSEYDRIVFLGDYLDPYSHEYISFDDAVLNFKEILEFKKDNWDKVVLLLGNHDMHYYDLDFMDCSRLNYRRRTELHNLYRDCTDCFQLVYLHDDCLFSHAGVYKDWLDSNGLTLQDVMSDDFIDNHVSCLRSVSGIRGGWCKVGSCIWADIRDGRHYPLAGTYYQVVGHTQLRDAPYVTDKIACLDVRRCFELDTETKQITEVTDELNIINESSSN